MSNAFSFGRNRDRYIREHCSEAQAETSRMRLLDFRGAPVEGKSFPGIGCGGGNHFVRGNNADAGDHREK